MTKKQPFAGMIKAKRGRPGWALWIVVILVLGSITGCRVVYEEPHDRPTLYTSHMVSDAAADGDIAYAGHDTYIITSAQTTGTVLSGIDPDGTDEFRGFLDFPLGGPDGVPLGVNIQSATLEIFINRVIEPFPRAGVHLLLDLVSFQPPALIPDDFYRDLQPALLSLPVDFMTADEGTFVSIDVTPLMVAAQDATNFPISKCGYCWTR